MPPNLLSSSSMSSPALSIEVPAQDSPPAKGSTDTLPVATSPQKEREVIVTKDFGFLSIPKHLRHDPKHPSHFGLVLNATFGFSGTFGTCSLLDGNHFRRADSE